MPAARAMQGVKSRLAMTMSLYIAIKHNCHNIVSETQTQLCRHAWIV